MSLVRLGSQLTDFGVGAPANIKYEAVARIYGGIRQFEAVAAKNAALALNHAKRWVAAALVLLGLAAFAWWWLPTKTDAAPAQLQVTTAGDTVCGTLLTADRGAVRVIVDGESIVRTIDMPDVENLRIVAGC